MQWISKEKERERKREREREIDREREREKMKKKKKDTNQLYRILPQTGSSLVPLALPRRVH